MKEKIKKYFKKEKNEIIRVSISGGMFFGLMVLWVVYVFIPIDEFTKTHTFENTEEIVIFSMLGFLLTSVVTIYFGHLWIYYTLEKYLVSPYFWRKK